MGWTSLNTPNLYNPHPIPLYFLTFFIFFVLFCGNRHLGCTVLYCYIVLRPISESIALLIEVKLKRTVGYCRRLRFALISNSPRPQGRHLRQSGCLFSPRLSFGLEPSICGRWADVVSIRTGWAPRSCLFRHQCAHFNIVTSIFLQKLLESQPVSCPGSAIAERG